MGETGLPVSGVVVSASRLNSMRRKQLFPDRVPEVELGSGGFCITDSAGAFEIGGLNADEHDLYADAGNIGQEFLAARIKNVNVRGGETKTVDFTVHKGSALSGVCWKRVRASRFAKSTCAER